MRVIPPQYRRVSTPQNAFYRHATAIQLHQNGRGANIDNLVVVQKPSQAVAVIATERHSTAESSGPSIAVMVSNTRDTVKR